MTNDIYDELFRRKEHRYFHDVENAPSYLFDFIDEKFDSFLKQKSQRYREKHSAAIAFVLCNLWDELDKIPAIFGCAVLWQLWEEAELSPFIAPVRTNQSGYTFHCNNISFSSVVLWDVIENSSLSNLYNVFRGRYQKDKNIRLPSRMNPKWTAVKTLRDEYQKFSINSDRKRWRLLSNDRLLKRILSEECIDIRRTIPNSDRRKKPSIIPIPTSDIQNPEVEDSAVFLGELRKYTKNISLSLSQLSRASARIEEAEEEFRTLQLRKRVAEKIFPFVMGNEISKRNEFLKIFEGHPFPLKRVFHLQDDSLLWGRIYGFPSDYLTRWEKLLLQIDGEITTKIDVKSCIPQIACMMFAPDEDNNQDFYRFPSIIEKYSIGRDDMKSMFMSLCNAKSYDRWISSQKYHDMEDRKSNPDRIMILSKDEYKDILSLIMKERPFMERIIAHPLTYKRLIKEESDFMISCMREMMADGIKFLCNFDCFIVQDEDIIKNSVIRIMKSQSLKRWDKEINVETDEYFTNDDENSFFPDDD